MNVLTNTLLTATALAIACALLSVIVVLRRWALLGEGISHSGFGGAGTAWLLMLVIPALNRPWVPYVAMILFCLGTALAIGALSRRRAVHIDAAIGIFLTASLAWGIMGQQIFERVRATPTLFENLLFARVVSVSPDYARAAVAICIVVVLVVLALWKEIISYSFDPLLAETSGVRAGFIHYLLMLLIAVTIIVGVRIAGTVLITALLVLPGATALLLSARLQSVVIISTLVALLGAIGGLLIYLKWPFLPAGPMIVLIMFLEFAMVFAASRIKSTASVQTR